MNPLERLAAIERSILTGESSGISWYGIEIAWERGAKSKGDTIKRKGQYGHLVYWLSRHRDGLDNTVGRITREEAVKEITTPSILRQAVIDAETIITCGHCGKILIGEEAREARGYDKKQWSKFILAHHSFYEICPSCAKKFVELSPDR